MNRRDFTKIGLTSLVVCNWGCTERHKASVKKSDIQTSRTKQPNIVFIMADDHGPWAFGRGGCSDAKTPNLDKLAGEGGIFTRMFGMSAVCSPGRACILTGKYSTDIGITDFLPSDSDIGLEKDHIIWPQVLAEDGYATALFGKWHLGEKDRHHPTRHGYQEFKGWRIGAGISKDPVIEIEGEDVKVSGYTPDILTDYSIDFIKSNKDKPFLCSLHFWAPHANQGVETEGDRTWHPLKDEDWLPFKDIDPVIPNPDYPKLDVHRVRRMTREYLAAVHSIDRNVGRVVQTLEQLGIADNTIVIYTADNGYNIGHNGIWHKGNGWWILTDNRGNRPNLYDNSLRLPAIIRWPGTVAAGSVYSNTATTLDWFPTICNAAGIDVEKYGLRGRNLSPLFNGNAKNWNDDLFAQYQMWDWNQGGASLRTYRTPRWKLIRDFKGVIGDELYNLHEDPDECHNLIDSDEPRVKKHKDALNGKMLECMKNIDDPALSYTE